MANRSASQGCLPIGVEAESGGGGYDFLCGFPLYLAPKKFSVPMWPLNERRYPDYKKDRRDWKTPYASPLWGYDFHDDGWSGK